MPDKRRPWRRLLSSSPQLAADIEKLLPALLADAGGVEIMQLGERLRDGFAGKGDHGGGVAVGAAGRLGKDAVDHAEFKHVLGGDLHAVGGFLRLGAVAPENGGGGLRR